MHGASKTNGSKHIFFILYVEYMFPYMHAFTCFTNNFVTLRVIIIFLAFCDLLAN